MEHIRVLSIRKHKNVSFINAYNNIFGNIQYMISNELVSSFKCGDLVYCDVLDTTNNKGNPIKKITSISLVVPSTNFESYKGINNDLASSSDKDFINSRNCGSQLKLLKYKKDMLAYIRDILNSNSYFDASDFLLTTEHYKNGSNINEAQIKDREKNDPKYLRSTLEYQLKQITGTILQSTYAINHVFRNMGEDNSHINEFLMLEMVSLNNDLNEMLEFVKNIDNYSKVLANNYDIEIKDKELDIIEYQQIPNDKFELYKKDFKNTLVLNYPSDSPFIAKINDKREEARWYINGHWISHYYEDENNYENVKEQLKKEQEEDEDINPMSYLEWGIPYTTSMGLSIDRWLQMLLDMQNINSIANPISLDYVRKRR